MKCNYIYTYVCMYGMVWYGTRAMSPGLPGRLSGRQRAAAPAALPAQDAGALRWGGGGENDGDQ